MDHRLFLRLKIVLYMAGKTCERFNILHEMVSFENLRALFQALVNSKLHSNYLWNMYLLH